MVEITDRESLKTWLDGREPADAVAIAARAALRVLPRTVALVRQEPEKWSAALLLPLFRASSLSWVAAVGPTHDIVDAAYTAANAAYASHADAMTAASHADAANAVDAAYVAANAAHAAANVADVAGDVAADAITAAADAVTAAADAANPAAMLWKAIAADVNALDQNIITATDLVQTRHWPEGVEQPSKLLKDWDGLRRLLLEREGEDWRVWTDWYDARLAGGGVINPDLETARALIPNKTWKQGPKVVNAEIRRLIDLHQPEPSQFPQAGRFEDDDRRIDADDLAEAHEISTDQQARDLHREAMEALQPLSGPASAGNNRRLDTGLPALADAALAALGDAPSSVRAHTLVLKTAKFEKALAADDRRGEDPDPDRPPLEAAERELLDNIVDALGFFIRTDTHLAGMQRLLRDEPTVDVPKDDVLLLVQRAVDEGAATKGAQDVVEEAVEEGGESGRLTVANFFIAALKIGKAVVVGGFGVAAIARWLVHDEEKIIALLEKIHPGIVPTMQALIDLLKTLPIGKP